MATASDEFEIRARRVLANKSPKLLADLLALREKAQRTAIGVRTPSAQALNAQNQRLFDKAAMLLGPNIFKDVFGFYPDEKIDLVDPALMAPDSRVYNFQASRAGRRMVVAAASKPSLHSVTLRHFAAALAETHELSKKEAEAVLGDFVGNIVKHLKKGERIRIGGLGILQVRKRAARMGRNPATGEHIQIKASKKVAFRAAKELKESI